MKYPLFALAALVFVSGCSSVVVSRDYDQSADFSRLKTFAWQHARQPATGNPRVDNDLIDARIRRAVNDVLESKGFQPEAAGSADFLLAYFVEYKSRIDGSMLSFGLGAGIDNRYGGVGYSAALSETEEGVLMIDIMDASTQKTIWRGVGTRMAYAGSNPATISKITNTAVSRILDRFPPNQ